MTDTFPSTPTPSIPPSFTSDGTFETRASRPFDDQAKMKTGRDENDGNEAPSSRRQARRQKFRRQFILFAHRQNPFSA